MIMIGASVLINMNISNKTQHFSHQCTTGFCSLVWSDQYLNVRELVKIYYVTDDFET